MNHTIYNVSASCWYIYLEKVDYHIKLALYISTDFSFSSFPSSSSFCITNTVNNISINISLFPKSIQQEKNEFVLSQLCCDDFNSINHIFSKIGDVSATSFKSILHCHNHNSPPLAMKHDVNVTYSRTFCKRQK